MIELNDLSRIYRTADVETTALNGVTMEIERGEFIAVMGPSGCGKSTLLNILGMLDSPTSGSYRFAGEEISGRSERALASLRKQNLGFIFQSFNLIDELSVAENVELPLLYQRVVTSPKLILADEPTGNLDTTNGEQVLDLLGQLNADGTTIVMVTHDQSHADHASRVVHMLDGRVLSENIVELRQQKEAQNA